MRDHVVDIEFCTQCRWMMRAAWVAQELLITFEDDLRAVSLLPGSGGVFDVKLDGEILFSRKLEGQFPELKILKQRIRDAIDPNRNLGHSDAK